MNAVDAAGNPAVDALVYNWTVALTPGLPSARILDAPLGLIGSPDPSFNIQVLPMQTMLLRQIDSLAYMHLCPSWQNAKDRRKCMKRGEMSVQLIRRAHQPGCFKAQNPVQVYETGSGSQTRLANDTLLCTVLDGPDSLPAAQNLTTATQAVYESLSAAWTSCATITSQQFADGDWAFYAKPPSSTAAEQLAGTFFTVNTQLPNLQACTFHTLGSHDYERHSLARPCFIFSALSTCCVDDFFTPICNNIWPRGLPGKDCFDCISKKHNKAARHVVFCAD